MGWENFPQTSYNGCELSQNQQKNANTFIKINFRDDSIPKNS